MTQLRKSSAPLLVGAFLATLAVVLWYGLNARERAQLELHVAAAAQEIARSVDRSISDRTSTLDRMARRWSQRGGTPRTEWEADAARYVIDQPGYQAISWVDASFHVRWIVPLAGNEQALGLDLGFEARRRAALEQVRNSGSLTLTRTIDLVQGGRGFLAYVPVHVDGAFDGLISAVFRVDDLLNRVLAPQLPSFHIAVYDGDNLIYGDDLQAADIGAASEAVLQGVTWRFQVAPAAAFVKSSHSWLPEIVLLTFLVIALLSALSTAFGLSARQRHAALGALEAHLEDREALLARAERIGGLGHWSHDLRTEVVTYSDQMLRTLGLDRRELVRGRGAFTKSVHPDDAERVMAAIQEIKNSGGPEELAFRIIRPDNGKVRHVNVRCEVTLDQGGRPIVVAGTTLDITERVQAQEAIGRSEAQLRLVADNIPAFVALVTRDQRYVFANQMYQRWFGPEPVVGRAVAEVLGDRLSPEIEADVEAVLRGETIDRQRTYEIAGEQHRVQVSLVPDRDERGAVVGYYVFGVDVTKLHKVTKRLQKSNRELESFAYVASHDLQEPLRMVQSFCELLARRYQGQLDADADEYIGFAVDGAKRMRALINDLLEYSRAQSVELTVATTDLNEVMSDAITNLRSAIEESGARIEIARLPQIRGDHAQLTRLFANLIGNAVKFVSETALPRIEISATRAGSFWEISVKDNGIGIASEHRDRIFGIFQRLHAQQEFVGTGIGLTVARQIAERHGGDIRMRSEVGAGTTFFVTLVSSLEASDPEMSTQPNREAVA